MTSTPPSTSTLVIPSGVPSAPTTLPIEGDDGTPVSPPTTSLALDAPSRQAALATGTRAMQLYLRRNVTAAQWWTDLVPLMTMQAQQAYRGTDPAKVPATTITGPGSLTPASTDLMARVAVPSGNGAYLVILARTPDAPQWRVDRIVPPENIGEP